MIMELEKNAPENVIGPILEFKEYSLRPLNSYAHGGLHSIDRHSKGYPLPILKQSLKVSNGINGLVAVFGSILTGQSELTKEVYKSLDSFSDCFQPKGVIAL